MESFFLDQHLEIKMSNLDNQPGRDNRAGLDPRTSRDRTDLDNRRGGIGAGTITAIIAALVIAGALMLFGPWSSNNHSAANNSTPATSNSTAGTTTGQASGAPVTPRMAPAAPSAPATNR